MLGAFGYVPEFDLWFVSTISVILFFYGGQAMSRGWERKTGRAFIQNIFIAGFVVRLLWVLYCYFFFNMDHYGFIYGDDADTGWYMDVGKSLSKWLAGESRLIRSDAQNAPMTIKEIMDYHGCAIDDVGYPMWLGFVYMIVGVKMM